MLSKKRAKQCKEWYLFGTRSSTFIVTVWPKGRFNDGKSPRAWETTLGDVWARDTFIPRSPLTDILYNRTKEFEALHDYLK